MVRIGVSVLHNREFRRVNDASGYGNQFIKTLKLASSSAVNVIGRAAHVTVTGALAGEVTGYFDGGFDIYVQRQGRNKWRGWR